VLGQKIPTTRFFPSDYRKELDIIAARSATDLAPLMERQNRVSLLNLRIAYLMYTHGICGVYTRYLVDGERFGFRDVDQISMVPTKLSEDRFECPSCYSEVPMQNAATMTCPHCGGELTEGDFVPGEMGEVPQVTATVKTAKGQQVISIHGGLELRLPPWVSDQPDMPYLGLHNEVHKSQLLHTYGKRAEGIEGTGSAASASEGGSGTSCSGDYDRYARLLLNESTNIYYSAGNKNLATLKRYWLRPASFEMVKGEDTQGKKYSERLKEIFPTGAYLAMATDKLLDVRDESMDDHWELVHAHEGPGMYKPALGSSAISINKRINTLENFIMEWVEYSAAGQGTLINSAFLNVNALAGQSRVPGNIYGVKAPINMPLGNLVYESRPGQIASEVFGQSGRLEKKGETVTGAVPTISGGTEQSLKPTTYLADREQALGKMYGPWLHMRTAWANIMVKSIREWAKSEADDVAYTVHGQNGEYEGREILVDNLKGQIEAYPETNEAFPELWTQQSAIFLKLMEMSGNDPFIQEILGHTNNMAYGKAMLGLRELFIPREDDRTKQLIEIRQLLQGQPEVVDTPDGLSAIMPSIQIGKFEDNHQEHIQAVKEWAVSADGLKAKRDNQMGYQNVIAHGVAHEEFLRQKQRQLVQEAQAMAPQPVAGPGKPKAPPSPASA